MRIYQLELTNHCNLHCSFCPTSYQWTHREKGFMDETLLDRIDFGDTQYIELQHGGEPTLHPRIQDIRQYLQVRGMKVGMATNGTLPNFDYRYFDIVTITHDIERHRTIEGSNVYLQKLGENYPYEDYSHEKFVDNPSVKQCLTPYEYVSIHWDGDVVPCCKCFGKQHVFGNVYDMTMKDIWMSEKRRRFLQDLKSNYICRYCNVPNPHKIHEKLLSEIMK